MRLYTTLVLVCGMAGVCGGVAFGQTVGWMRENPQHSALSAIGSQPMQAVHWSTPVDLDPQYAASGDLYIHYGSPMITSEQYGDRSGEDGAIWGVRTERVQWGHGNGVVVAEHGLYVASENRRSVLLLDAAVFAGDFGGDDVLCGEWGNRFMSALRWTTPGR